MPFVFHAAHDEEFVEFLVCWIKNKRMAVVFVLRRTLLHLREEGLFLFGIALKTDGPAFDWRVVGHGERTGIRFFGISDDFDINLGVNRAAR